MHVATRAAVISDAPCYHSHMRFAVSLVLIACGCPATKGPDGPHVEAKVDEVVAKLTKKQSELNSFLADSTMDYWLGSQRAKGEVLVMGAVGAKMRFAALSPAGRHAWLAAHLAALRAGHVTLAQLP